MSGAPLSLVVIGHVNHGKTALVRALTGMETDRLAEEKARGLSITLGFAWRGDIEFIDAPGHEDFIRAMVMGATGARAALLVVSATEGFGRQTREHLRIAGLLGIKAGVVATTKTDLLAEGEADAVRARVAAELEGTFLAREPVVLCSALSGAGLDALQGELQGLAARSPLPQPPPGAWLPLDRVFSLTGAGTVATGTLQGGALAGGDAAVLQPSGREVVLRQVQAHGVSVEAAAPGGRVAVGLRGISADEVRAGEVLCAPGAYAASLLVDAKVTLAAECARPLKAGDEVRVMWGARQDLARVRPLDGAIAPGERGLARLRFTGPVVAYAGQRAILRRPSPAETIGGFTVLDPVAPQVRGGLEARRSLLEAAAQQDLDAIARELAARDGGALSVAETARLARRTAAEVRERLAFDALDADLMATREAVDSARRAYLDAVAEAHREAPARVWATLGAVRGRVGKVASRALIAFVEQPLAAEGEIRLDGARIALAGHDPLAALSPTALARLTSIEAAFRAGGTTPPDLRALPDAAADDGDLIGLLVDTGRLVMLRNVALRQTVAFHAKALDEAVAALAAAFPPPAEFATGEARAALATSRKFIVPVLEHLDARGDTVRRGDVRQVVENRFGTPRKPA